MPLEVHCISTVIITKVIIQSYLSSPSLFFLIHCSVLKAIHYWQKQCFSYSGCVIIEIDNMILSKFIIIFLPKIKLLFTSLAYYASSFIFESQRTKLYIISVHFITVNCYLRYLASLPIVNLFLI